MRTWSLIENDDGRSFVRETKDGRPPAYRVDIVAGENREPTGEYSDIEDANRLADWFGREGYLHAEVVEIGGAA